MAAQSRLPAGLAAHISASIAAVLEPKPAVSPAAAAAAPPQPERQQPEQRLRRQTRAAALLLHALEELAAAEQPGSGSEGERGGEVEWDKVRAKGLAQRVRARGESIIKRARRDASLRQRMLAVEPGPSAAALILQAEGAAKQSLQLGETITSQHARLRAERARQQQPGAAPSEAPALDEGSLKLYADSMAYVHHYPAPPHHDSLSRDVLDK